MAYLAANFQPYLDREHVVAYSLHMHAHGALYLFIAFLASCLLELNAPQQLIRH